MKVRPLLCAFCSKPRAIKTRSFKNYRFGQLKFTFFYSVDKLGVCPLRRTKQPDRVDITLGEVTPTYELFLEMLHPDDRAVVTGSLEETLQEKKPYKLERRIVRRDGVMRIAESTGVKPPGTADNICVTGP